MHDAYIILWNTMIRGHVIYGYNKDTLKLFDLMKHLGTKPNIITFLRVLLTCNCVGEKPNSANFTNFLLAYTTMGAVEDDLVSLDLF